jgi:hypothetical protein
VKSPSLTARALLVTGTAAAYVAGLALPAGAEEPEGWSSPEKVDPLHALLVLGGIPLALFILIGLAVYLPSVMRGEGIAPVQAEDHWLGGSAKSAGELKSAQANRAEADQTEADQVGGGSGTW